MNAFERFFKTLGHAVAWPFAHGTQVVKTIETVMVDEPIVKDGLVGLVKHIQTVTEDSAVAIAAKGLDLPDDIQTAKDAAASWAYIRDVFIPDMKKAYTDVKADLESPVPADASGLAVAPGLHTIVPA